MVPIHERQPLLRACIARCLSWPPLALLLAFGTAALLPAAPPFRAVPGRDSGVFLYVASRILGGGMPYRDVWDHKPPAIYYLDALGLTFCRTSTWGVWLIQVLFVCSAVALGFALMRNALGTVPALFGSVAWISSLGILLIWDNYPEEFALPLQFASVYLFCVGERWRPRSGYGWRGALLRAFLWALIGALMSVCFLLKPTLVGTQVAIVLLLTLRLLRLVRVLRRTGAARTSLVRCVCLARDLAAICAGALLVLAPVAAYFLVQGVLGEALDAVFRYGALYSAAPPTDRLLAIVAGLGGLPALSGAPAIALVSWTRIRRREMGRAGRARADAAAISNPDPASDDNNDDNDDSSDDPMDLRTLLARLTLVWLPLELLLVAVPGRSYGYYYTAWLPVLGILCALFARAVVSERSGRQARFQTACLCAFLPVMVAVPVMTVLNRLSTPALTATTRVEAARYIERYTSESDSVLMWGAEPGVNFAAGRPSPTRFAYQYALYTRGYVDSDMVGQFLRDIEKNEPSLIIDASSSDKITPPIDAGARARWAPVLVYDVPPAMQGVYDYIGSHYRFVGSLGVDGWKLYARKLSCVREAECEHLK